MHGRGVRRGKEGRPAHSSTTLQHWGCLQKDPFLVFGLLLLLTLWETLR